MVKERMKDSERDRVTRLVDSWKRLDGSMFTKFETPRILLERVARYIDEMHEELADSRRELIELRAALRRREPLFIKAGMSDEELADAIEAHLAQAVLQDRALLARAQTIFARPHVKRALRGLLSTVLRYIKEPAYRQIFIDESQKIGDGHGW
jgi:hypothetical protein